MSKTKKRAANLGSLRVAPGEAADIGRRATRLDLHELDGLNGEKREKAAKKLVKSRREQLAEIQELLFADDRYSVLMIFQGMDASGKDGTIKYVMSGVNPQGCDVRSFKQPSAEEIDHSFLWRYQKAVPERGRIGIFNRSYYEDVLVVRVHPEILAQSRLPDGARDERFWRARFDDINAFERHLARNGYVVLKFFLHVSKDEQRRRFLERLDEPEKHWKFSTSDLETRSRWDDYAQAFEAALTATSTEWAPWHVVPADDKWSMRVAVAQITVEALSGLDLRYPQPTAEKLALLEGARAQLLDEPD